ncbi:hypothetical protein [Komagataeibacter sp. FNDCF1]|uniref:hypothetical protein n=1 Tax=Komagataeibacter sp. FNDCF1 TaxID=2878681 RepID=UPI001E645DFD|nr:hypothetical protein [Komagataeibacter sp. FNDCF1]MCE2564644.1 hypothetical protein [Komagataeibacter sp. FNDCF1]
MSKGKHSAYQNEFIRDFIAANVHHMTIDALRSGLLGAFPGHDIPSRSSLGRYVAALPKKYPRLTERHPAFRDHAVRALVDTWSQQHMTVDEIGAALAAQYPDKEMPSRSSLWRYLAATGRTGKWANWSRHPQAQAYLHDADPSLSIRELRKGLSAVLPPDKVPERSAISRCLQKAGGKKERANTISAHVRELVDDMVYACSIDTIRKALTASLPDAMVPSRSALGRYVKKVRDSLKQAHAA